MQEQTLEFVTTLDELDRVQRPLALTYNDPLTGSSGEYLAFLCWREQHVDRWAMYHGPGQHMVRSDLRFAVDWLSAEEVRMEIKSADRDYVVDHLHFNPFGNTLWLEDVPKAGNIEWKRVSADNFTLELGDEGRTLKLTKK